MSEDAIRALIDPDCRDGKHGSCVGGPCECTCHSEPAPESTPQDTAAPVAVTWIRGLLHHREKPPRLFWRELPRRSPGWHVINRNWAATRAPGDLTAAEVMDVFEGDGTS